MRTLSLILVALICSSSFGQSLTVSSFEAIEAKAVKIEQLAESVAVILTDRQPGTRTGAYLQITSPAKWATPLLDGVNITATKIPGEWLVFAPAGKYRVLLAEFDPETGPRYTYHDLVIGKATEPNPDPIPDPPPVGDYESIKEIAKLSADKLSDPKTRSALASAYKTALKSGATQSYDAIVNSVKTARRFALIARQGESLMKDWNAWLIAVDDELRAVVKIGDADAYRAALAAIIAGLEG